MPRNARKYKESQYSHLIVQGINQEEIFKNNEWKEEYLKIIKQKTEEDNIEILGYCIMNNHAHFLVYYNSVQELSELMRKVNTTYAMKYNRINRRKGFVFRDRYFTQPILDENQLFNCLVYIHKNPIEAGVCNNIKSYKYSSYNEYKNRKKIISNNSIKLLFGIKKNYMEQFDYIHNFRCDIQDIKEISEYEIFTKEICDKYYNKIKNNIQNNEEEIGKILLEIRQKYGLSLREMAKRLKMNKDKLNSYIHQTIKTL